MIRAGIDVTKHSAFLVCIALMTGILTISPVFASDENWVRTIVIEDEFESAESFLRSSIEEEGLTIANEGHVSDMLARTRDAFEGTEIVFAHAKIYQFCSARLGVALFAIAPDGIGACPLNIFAYQLKNDTQRVVIGYRRAPVGLSGPQGKLFDEINVLLERILTRAAE